MPRSWLAAVALCLSLLAAAPALAQATAPSPGAGYRIGPGDELTVNFLLNPEMNTKVAIGPDGRGVFPYISSVPLAGLTVAEANQALTAAYGKVLRNPYLETLVATYTSPQIYVGGEVRTAGAFPFRGEITTAKAVMLAGGLQPTAKTGKVMVLREDASGVLQTRAVDVKRLLTRGGGYDNFLLEAGDIVFVPRSSLAEVALFVEQLKTALPVSFNYNLGERY